MNNPSNTINLQDGDKLVLESGPGGRPMPGQRISPGGEYSVRLFRKEKDMGLVTYADDQGNMRILNLHNENPTLTLTGKSENASVEIPAHSGIEATDFIPKLNIQTDSPLLVKGGAFVSAAGSTQEAIVPITATGLASVTITRNKTSGDTFVVDAEALMENGETDKRFATNTLLLKLMQDQGRSMVAVERDSAGITFINKNDDNAALLTIDGIEPPEATKAQFASFQQNTKSAMEKAWADKDVAAIDKLGLPKATPAADRPTRATETPPREFSLKERTQVRQEGNDVINALNRIGNTRLSDGTTLRESEMFKADFHEAHKAAQDFANTGVPTPAKIERLDNAIDALAVKAEETANISIKRSVEKIKDGYERIRELGNPPQHEKDPKSARVDDLSEDVLAAARGAVDPIIGRGQKPEERVDGSPDAPRVQDLVSKGNFLV